MRNSHARQSVPGPGPMLPTSRKPSIASIKHADLAQNEVEPTPYQRHFIKLHRSAVHSSTCPCYGQGRRARLARPRVSANSVSGAMNEPCAFEFRTVQHRGRHGSATLRNAITPLPPFGLAQYRSSASPGRSSRERMLVPRVWQVASLIHVASPRQLPKDFDMRPPPRRWTRAYQPNQSSNRLLGC